MIEPYTRTANQKLATRTNAGREVRPVPKIVPPPARPPAAQAFIPKPPGYPPPGFPAAPAAPPAKRFRVVDTRNEAIAAELCKEAAELYKEAAELREAMKKKESDAGDGLVEVKEQAVKDEAMKEEESDAGDGLVEVKEQAVEDEEEEEEKQKSAKKVHPRFFLHPV